MGINWVQKFYQRHKELKTVKIRALGALCIQGANFRHLKEWFTIAKENLHSILLDNVFNMNETCVMLRHLYLAK